MRRNKKPKGYRKRRLMKNMTLIFTFTLIANIIITFNNPTTALAGPKTQVIKFEESSSRTQSRTITLPDAKTIESVKVDTGTVTHTQTGDTVNLTVSEGEFSSRESYIDPKLNSRVVSDTSTSSTNSFANTKSYSRDGYTGSLVKDGAVTSVQTGGNYIPEASTYISSHSSSYYSSGGYSGYLSQFVTGGIHTPADTKYMTTTQTGGRVEASTYYNDGTYSGALERTGYSQVGTYDAGGEYISENCTYHEIPGHVQWVECDTVYLENMQPLYAVYFGGYVSRPEVDTRTFAYQGTVYKPAVDTRTYSYTQKYRGEVYSPGTNYRNYKYTYNVTIDYTENKKPNVTLDSILGEYNSNEHFFISGTINDENAEDNIKHFYSISEDKNDDGVGDTPVVKHTDKYIVKFTSDTESQHYSKAVRVNTTDFPTDTHSDNYYQVSVWAEDNFGNKSEVASTMVKIRLNNPPIVKLDPTNNGKIYSEIAGFNQIKVIGTISDTDINDSLTVKYTINELDTHVDLKVTTGEIISDGEEKILSGTINIDETIPEGNYTAKIWAEDNYGGKQTSEETLSFKVDKTSPTQTNNNPDSWTSTKDKPFDLTLDISDNIAGIESVKLPDGKSTEYKTPFAKEQQLKYALEDNGEYAFVITDAVGNSRIHTINVTHLDKTAPTITADPDKYGPTKQQIDVNFTINDSGSGVDTRQYILSEFNTTPASDDPLWKYLPNTVKIDEEGNWYLHTKVVDKAGNEFIKTFGPYVLRIDKSKPDVYVVIEDNKPSVPQGKTTLKVDITGIDDLSKPEELTVEVSTDLITWTPARNLGEGGKIETEVTIPKDTPIGKNVTVYARISDDIGNAGYGSDDIIYGKNLDVDDTGELNVGDEEKLGPYTWIYIGNNRFIMKDSLVSRWFGRNNTFDIKENTNIALYLDNDFLDRFPPDLQRQFVDFEEYAWKNGDSTNEGLVKKTAYVGLLTESEAKELFWLDNLPGVGLTLTKTPGTINQIRVVTPAKKVVSQMVNTYANVHPVVKLKEGYTVRNGKVIKIGTNGQILDRLEKFDEKVNAISAVTSLNRLTSRVDNKIELAVVGDSDIELKAVVQGIDSSRFRFNEDRITIDINGIISANIPDVITVYGYKDKNGDGVTTTGEMVAKFEIYKKDYFFEASSVD